ncbi:LacI family DNA-binding transcriptional regulator [Fusibacter bizertensis]
MASIKEIAKLAKVSPMTVSNVIHKKSARVSAETRERIEKIIQELDYVPNMSARALVSNRSNIVVLAIPQTLSDDPNKNKALINPFYGEIINSIEYHLRQEGYYLMLRFVSETDIFSSMVVNWNADGVILLGAMDNQLDLNFKNIKIPLVLIDSYVSQFSYDNVMTDDFKGGYLATEHLIKTGHKKIGMILTAIDGMGVAQQRYKGFKQAMEDYNCFVDHDLVFEGHPTYEYGYEVGRKLIDKVGEIDGLFAYSDLVAIGVIQGMKDKGIIVPRDISIIGFDGLFIGNICEPRLTTVYQDIDEKGKQAVELLINRIKGKTIEPQKVILPVSLIERDSVN